MKKGLIFSLVIAFLVWPVSSLAWYPEQEKDGIKDDKSPEEAKKLIEQGQYGARTDYEPKPGYPWKEDLEKGTVTGEQLDWLRYDNKDHVGFYSRQFWRSSLYLNARGYYGGSSGVSYRYYYFNEEQPKWEDNFGDTLTYHEGKLKEGDLFTSLMHLWYWPSLEVGNNMMNLFYIKTPRLYKEQDIWRYFANRRKVIRLAASDKAESIGGGTTTYDDIGSRTPWEYSHKIIGTDVINPQDYFFEKNPLEKMKPPIKDMMKAPIECWVVESNPRDPGYYLGKIIYWIAKGKNRGDIVPIREEQYDRQMNLWKVREYLWSNPKEDGDRSGYGWTTWDLRLDFKDWTYFNDGSAPVHNLPIPGGFDKKRFFSLETLKSEWRWFDIPSERLRRKNWEVWRNHFTPPALMRNKFPEHRKIVLRKEVEEKIKKLVEKGIFE